VSEHASGVGGVFTPCDMDLLVCDACVHRQRTDEPLGNLATNEKNWSRLLLSVLESGALFHIIPRLHSC